MDLLTANDKFGEYPNSYYAWNSVFLPSFEISKGELKCDVCIVGAGYTGLSAAIHLAEEGYKVIVLEAQRVGFGASGRNGGQVGTGQRVNQLDLEKLVGNDNAHRLWDISLEAVELVKKLSKDIKGCAFQPGIVHASHKKSIISDEHHYVDHLRKLYNYKKIQKLNKEELRNIVNTEAYFGGYLDTGSGHVDPLNYVLGLAKKAHLKGVKIFEKTRALEILQGASTVIKTPQSKVTASYVIFACNGYQGAINDKNSNWVMPINNFIVATRQMSKVEQERLIKNNYAVSDTKFIVNYFRFSKDRRLLFGGSESYGYKFPKDIEGKVRKPMLNIFPQLKGVKIDFSWGGTLGITMNRMPYFAKVDKNIISASGYSGHGVAMATMGGKLAAMAISGQAEKFDLMAKVPTPKFPGGGSFQKPLLVLAMLWFSLRDKL